MRKIINYAFSERVLQDQEPQIQAHVETLIHELVEQSKQASAIDLNEWYNCTAFDIIADTALGEPFDTLQDPTHRLWLYLIGKTWKAIVYASAIKSIAPRLLLLRRFLPTGAMLQKEVDKFNLVLNRVKQRMIIGPSNRMDLLSSIMRKNDRKERMTDQEIIANATLFVAAGTETVTTVLSALTYFLTKNKSIMEQLCKEVREAFSDESQITIQAVSRLQYMTACIQEALRLFPPIPEGLPRVVPAEGEDICGRWVPGGVLLAASLAFFQICLTILDLRSSQQSRN